MPLVWDEPQRVADWVGERCGVAAPTVDAAIGYVSDGQLKAGVYFESMLPNTVFAHIASCAKVMPRSLLVAVCIYAFSQLGVERITFLVSEANPKVLAFVKSLGSEYEGRMKRAFGDADGLWFAFWRNSEWAQRLLAEPGKRSYLK